MNRRTPKAIGKDVTKVTAFRFGMYRYQAEHFNHNKKSQDTPAPDLLLIGENPMKRGTKVYRFVDRPEWNRRVAVTILFDEFLEEEEYGEHFLDSDYALPSLKPERVDHGYPECEPPYDRCPVCGAPLDESVLEPENAEDVFNARSGWGPDGEWSYWEEVHRCPQCGKRFYIEEST